MRRMLLGCLLTVSAAAQTGKLGVFTNSGDVGDPALKGSTEFDASKGQYRITGSGANMWAKADQFQYVWREMQGDMTVSATLEFLGEGAAHRKAGIMLRKALETDAPYVDVVIHGNGMPAIQWRQATGDITNAIDLPIDSPGRFNVKLTRRGGAVTVWIGKSGEPLKEIGSTQVQLGSPIYVGLAVCSHQPDHSDTVVFSGVSIEGLAAARGTGK